MVFSSSVHGCHANQKLSTCRSPFQSFDFSSCTVRYECFFFPFQPTWLRSGQLVPSCSDSIDSALFSFSHSETTSDGWQPTTMTSQRKSTLVDVRAPKIIQVIQDHCLFFFSFVLFATNHLRERVIVVDQIMLTLTEFVCYTLIVPKPVFFSVKLLAKLRSFPFATCPADHASHRIGNSTHRVEIAEPTNNPGDVARLPGLRAMSERASQTRWDHWPRPRTQLTDPGALKKVCPTNNKNITNLKVRAAGENWNTIQLLRH